MRAANSHWASRAEQEHVEAVVHEYPIQPGEGPYHYILRIAFESGLTKDCEGIRRWPAREAARTVAEVREDSRLPYREDQD